MSKFLQIPQFPDLPKHQISSQLPFAALLIPHIVAQKPLVIIFLIYPQSCAGNAQHTLSLAGNARAPLPNGHKERRIEALTSEKVKNIRPARVTPTR
ncbi:hypothetical protein L596_019300 [Steinernema carpocapsae]|uniref:Uncharacterized protein n=1 Tax=Steinernema carpocapsae TaxID=34508 RepID=A0A4U5MQN0_STECR|nr:hypothetical protein L596_019300 [Steinernema carpocapsae]